MSLINHCPTSGGQPGFPSNRTGIQDANQQYPVSLPLHKTHAQKLLQPNSTISSASITSTTSFILDKKHAIEELPHLLTKNDYSAHSMEFEALFTENVLGQTKFALAVSVSSAVKLDERQVSLIARKMKRLTGFNNLKMENTIDPSLIAGFVISYGDDESHVIDLSVKGQLDTLASRVECFDQKISCRDGS